MQPAVLPAPNDAPAPSRWRPLLGLVPKFTAFIGTLLVAFAVAQTWINIAAQEHTIEDQMRQRSEATAEALAHVASDALRSGIDEGTLRRLVAELAQQHDVLYLAVLDWDGSVLIGRAPGDRTALARADDPLSRAARLEGRRAWRLDEAGLHVAVPVPVANGQLGAVSLGLSSASMTEQRAEMRARNRGVVAAFLAVGLLLTYALVRRITRPIAELITTTEAVADGRRDGRIVVRSRDELELLAAAFNRMLDRLAATTVSRDQMTRILRSMSEALVVLGPDGRIVLANAAMSRLTGYGEAELSGMLFDRLLVTADPRLAPPPDLLDRLQRERTLERFETYYRSRSGQRIAVLVSAALAEDHDDPRTPPGIICVAQDDRERRRQQEKVRRLAYFDSVTGLPNRVQFDQALQEALRNARRADWKVAVLFLDLDQFKRINDTLGHATGDRLLEAFAARLAASLRGGDLIARSTHTDRVTLARLGGDEFTVLLSRIGDVADAVAVARRVLAELAPPFRLAGRDVVVAASVGIAVYPDDSPDAQTLLMHADAAMYQAKAAGRGTYRVFDADVEAGTLERLNLEGDLRHALDRGELGLVFQPQLALDGEERVVGAEVLLRWRHPSRGPVPPNVFVPLAEESGMIHPIGAWLLQQSCRQARSWLDRGRPLRVAVNISAYQLRRPDFVAQVVRALGDTGLPAHLLEIEITESAAMADPEAMISRLSDLKALGLDLALDDFGTGYSSLAYLKRFPLDRLKIDRSFIQDVATDENDAEIVNAILAMAHQLRLRVVAEGVEDEEQLALLRRQGCDEVQGYLLSRPLPAEALDRWLAARGVPGSPPPPPSPRPTVAAAS